MGFRSRRPLVPVTFALVAGVYLGSLTSWQWWPVWIIAYCLGVAAWVTCAERRPKTACVVVMGCVVLGGAALAAIRGMDSDCDGVHRAGLEGIGPVLLTGRVASMPELRGGGRGAPLLEFILGVEWIAREGGTWEPSSGRVRVVIEGGMAGGIVYGGRLAVRGDIRRPAKAMNPGEFDARAYWGRRGVAAECRIGAEAVERLDSGGPGWLAGIASDLRAHMRKTLGIGIEKDRRITAVIAGMIYGDRAGFPDALTEAFRRTGTMHLFAVSGQNVGVIAVAGIAVLCFLGFNRWRWGWVMVPILGLYTLATGAQASAVRAFGMAALVLLAWFMDRPVSAAQLLAGAASVMVLSNPAQLWDVGFQMSFSVVLALVALTPVLYSRMVGIGAPDAFVPRRLWPIWLAPIDRARRAAIGTVAASVAAYVGSAPLTAWYFHMFSPVSVFVNVAVVPLASVVVIGGGLSLAGSALHDSLAFAFNKINWVVATAIVGLVEFSAGLPLASFNVGAPCMDSRLVVLSVGEGQAVVVQDGPHCDAYDCGSRAQMRPIVAPALRYLGINRIHRLWLSHNDSAHVGGAENLIASWPVSELAVPRAPGRRGTLTGIIERHAMKARPLGAGDTLIQKRFTWRVLHPVRGEHGSLADDMGIVARVEWDGGSVLLMGDAGSSVEKRLVMRGAELRSDVVVVGRHVGEESLTEEFLRAVSPRHVVFNAGSRTRQKIDDAQRRRIEDGGATLWDTSEIGAVMIRCGRRGAELTAIMKDGG